MREVKAFTRRLYAVEQAKARYSLRYKPKPEDIGVLILGVLERYTIALETIVDIKRAKVGLLALPIYLIYD